MRGLKPFTVFCFVEEIESHLLQMRGLKHLTVYTICYDSRRIFYRCVD